MVLEIEPRQRREYTTFCENQNSRIYAAITGQTTIGPVLQVHIKRYLGISAIEIQIFSTTTEERTIWVVIAEGKTATCMMHISMIQNTIPEVLSCYWKVLLQKKEILVQQRWSHHRASVEIQTNSVYNYWQEVYLIGEGKWNDILVCQHFRGHFFEAEVSNLVKRLVRHYDQDERATDGVVHWNWKVQNCEQHFRRLEGNNSRTLIHFSKFMKEATRRGASIAIIPETSYSTIVPFKDISVNLITLELVGHVAIPYKWQ